MLPKGIDSGRFFGGHCQGIAVDPVKGFIYYSFTTLLVKTDFQGNLIGTAKGLLGHLGCIDFNDQDGMVYGSLEYKNDAIGQGILKRAGIEGEVMNAFYCAIFDVDRIVRPDMDACADGVMRTAYLKDVVDDYLWEENGKKHYMGCSGIDGTAIGPLPGMPKDSKRHVLISYGIYGDVERDDNDQQVILAYDPDHLKAMARPLEKGNMHTEPTAVPVRRLYAYTGNTTYGIQNLEYDETTGDYLAAVYVGKKPIYANKPMYVFAGDRCTEDGHLTVKAASDFPYGQTGMCSLADGLYYFSEDEGNKTDGWCTHVHLYKRENDSFIRL